MGARVAVAYAPSGPPTPAAPPSAEAAVRALVRDTVRAAKESFGGGLRAVVLTGSVARDEGTFARRGDDLVLLGDAEFLAVFHDRTPLPEPAAVAAAVRALEEGLRREGVRGTIGLSPCHAGHLQAMGSQIFAYELAACGRVVWGDAGVLSLVPRIAAADIDRADAWTMLCNRLVEQLGALGEREGGETVADAALAYRTAKVWLDMATSFLVFTGGYLPTYRGRAASLAEMAVRSPGVRDAPLDLSYFARRVQACTRFKLDAASTDDLEAVGTWREAVEAARQLWRWELARLTGLSADAPDRRLRERWMRQQSLACRARGWAYAVRYHGWQRSWRHWPRWARLARRGSPRHWVYAAATELLFALAARGATGADDATELRELARSLPVCQSAAVRDWRSMAAQIDHDYRTLLVETRA